MNLFRCKEFEVLQNDTVFKIGTDAILLGAYSNFENKKNILEIGTGSGIISLMLAQKNPKAKILAIDLLKESYELAKQNFQNSKFSSRLKVKNIDFLIWKPDKKFDGIIINPPYFKEKMPEKKDALFARTQTHLPLELLFKKCYHITSDNASLQLILPSEELESILVISKKYCWFLNKKVEIFGNSKTGIKRIIFFFEKMNNESVTEKLVIEKSHREFSEQYIELTKDFHPHF